MFTDWLVEAYYLRLFLQLSKIPHYTTLQKFTDRINIVMLGKIISSFIIFTNTRHIYAGIDSTGFKITHASEYYTSRAKLRRKKYAKLSMGADVLQQIFSSIKIRRAPTLHDNIDFAPIVTRISKIKTLSVVVADKAYDSGDNHILVRENRKGFSVIPSRYEHVPVWKTRGRYRKEMKRGYNKVLQSAQQR